MVMAIKDNFKIPSVNEKKKTTFLMLSLPSAPHKDSGELGKHSKKAIFLSKNGKFWLTLAIYGDQIVKTRFFLRCTMCGLSAGP